MNKYGVILVTAVAFLFCTSFSLGEDPTSAEFVRRAAARHAQTVSDTNRFVWNCAETAWNEVESSARLADTLEKSGFTVTRGIGDIKTAFRAQYGQGKPVLAILAEYDCLPNLGQEAGVATRQPIPGKPNGHGCGHSALGAGSLGAALIVKDYLEKSGKQGTIVLFGCPAEEGGQAKTFMVRSGCFQGIDAAVLWHPADRNIVAPDPWIARYSVIFSFKGIASHAGGAPEKGRSALDGCELMNIGVNYLREHIIQQARIHFAYLEPGAKVPNIVPEHARTIYYIRAPRLSQAKEILDRVIDVARGAALMSGTQMEYKIAGATSDWAPNPTMTQVLADAFTELGGPKFDENEQKLGRLFFAQLSAEEKASALALVSGNDREKMKSLEASPVATNVVTRTTPVQQTVSTDAGDVSQIVPSGQFFAATASTGTTLHSWQMTSQVGTTIGDKGALAAASVMALGCIRLFNEPTLVEKAKAEHKAMFGESYTSPLPDELRPGGYK
ncbi:MAG: amidohydrolase [Planctomycetia bacterium]|nr:amidohydrolase [Planctomycetia bacterium]